MKNEKVKSKIRKVYAKKNEPIGLILNYVLVGKKLRLFNFPSFFTTNQLI
jgi:hypothetical protein